MVHVLRPSVRAKDADWFIDQLRAVSPGNLRALWLPAPTDTTATNSLRPWTQSASIQGRITYQGNGILVSFNGTDQYVTTPDTADLSVGNGTTDGPLSLAVLANVTDTATNRMLLAKGAYSSGTAYEYALLVNTADALRFDIYDVSSGGEPRRISNAAITQGSVSLIGATYTAATGGATAANDMTLYQNGAVIASTATNAAAYVAMENGTAGVGVGQDVGPEVNLYFSGSIGFAAIYAAALTAAQHRQIANLAAEYYQVTL